MDRLVDLAAGGIPCQHEGMADPISFVSDATEHLDPGTYAWINIKRFDIDAHLTNAERGSPDSVET